MKESFDDILRKRWAEQQFPLDEDHRQGMIELLNTPRRRRTLPIWWFGGILILISIAGYYFLQQPADVKPAMDSILELDHERASLNSDDEADAESPQILLSEESSSSTSDAKAQVVNPTHSRPLKTESIQPGIGNKNELLIAEKQENQLNQSISKAHSRNPYPSIESEMETKTVVLLPANKTVQESSENSANLNGAPPSVDLDIDPNKKMVPALRDPGNITRPCPSLDLNSFDDPEPHSIVEIKSVAPHLKDHSPFHLFLETGVGMVLASKPVYESGWKLRAGGGLGYRLNSKFQMALSAGYLMQKGGFNFQKSSTISRPGFGLRSSFNTINPDRLHFIYSRIGGQYRIQRHILAAHGGIQLLYGAQGNIVIQKQDQFGTGSGEATQYTWLSIDGLRKMNMTADFSYGYQLAPRLAVHAGTDIYFSSFTVEDVSLSSDGYYWKGRQATLHPFITFNYQIYGNR